MSPRGQAGFIGTETGRNLSAPNVEKRPTEEFVRHRLVEYNRSFATICRVCLGWELGQRKICGNKHCRAEYGDLKAVSAKWSDRQAENDKMVATCVECKTTYTRCQCEWKRKYLARKKYDEAVEKESTRKVFVL